MNSTPFGVATAAMLRLPARSVTVNHSSCPACVPVHTRDSGDVIMAIKQARSRCPFPLLGVAFDNDSAFMIALVVFWCLSEDLEVTLSRAYRKNDQANAAVMTGGMSTVATAALGNIDG